MRGIDKINFFSHCEPLKLILLLLFFSFPFNIEGKKKEKPDALELHLNKPRYCDGVTSSEEGGRLCAENLYIQADRFEVIDRKGEHRVVASGNVFLSYYDKFVMCEKVEYDFTTKTGNIYEGVTALQNWYVSGKEIRILGLGEILVMDATITTSQSDRPEWMLNAGVVKLEDRHHLAAKDVTVRAFNAPIFWFPSFSMNTKKDKDPTFQYGLKFESKLHPMLMMRYKFYSWRSSDYFFRFEYRLAKGFGAALESNYQDEKDCSYFRTKSFYNYDSFARDNDPKKVRPRYRLQGIGEKKDPKGRFRLFGRWDKYSDKNMPDDFITDDFELNTALRTELIMNHTNEHISSYFYLRPRVNDFQGFKQEIPTVLINPKTVEVNRSGMLFESQQNASYLQYSYSDLVRGYIPDFHSGRVMAQENFLLPMQWQAFSATPGVGVNAMYYSNNPFNHEIAQAQLRYELYANTHLMRRYENTKHLVKPYLHFMGLSRPIANTDQHYIFGIEDGLEKIQQLKLGLQNTFYPTNTFAFNPPLDINAYLMGFFDTPVFQKAFPYFFLDLNITQPKYSFMNRFCWSTESNSVKFYILSYKWTINQYFAFNLLFNHRGKYEWRKADQANFILDVSHPIDDLLNSPISSNRNILVARWQIEPYPGWTAQIQNHVGWAYNFQPAYYELKVDLSTLVNSSWKFNLSFWRTVRDPVKVIFGVTSVSPG